ncbi:MAG: hypothetical protein SPI91_00990 [Bacilli bacterium]|jgi:outer membrane biosynthesis protein TonB|nr:hypothetical protein [Bacilli bacterium]
MKKKIIILILLIFSVSCVLVFNYAKTKNIKESTPIKIEKVEEDNTNNDTVIEETSTNDESDKEVVKEEPKIEIRQEEKKQETTTSSTPQKKQETPKKVEQQSVQQTTQQPAQVVEQEKPKQQTEWEKYGMSEYDYYHKPMWNWARVDYPTHEACIEAGEALGYEILSYSCLNINSTSGDYLGDMLKVKYPE